MAKYLLLKHYRGAPAPVNDVPMDQWSPEEISAHIQPRLLAALIPATSPSPTPTKSTAPGAPPRRRTQIDGFRESSVTAARRREIEVFAAARVGAMSCPQVQISMTSGGLTGLLCVLGGVA